MKSSVHQRVRCLQASLLLYRRHRYTWISSRKCRDTPHNLRSTLATLQDRAQYDFHRIVRLSRELIDAVAAAVTNEDSGRERSGAENVHMRAPATFRLQATENEKRANRVKRIKPASNWVVDEPGIDKSEDEGEFDASIVLSEMSDARSW